MPWSVRLIGTFLAAIVLPVGCHKPADRSPTTADEKTEPGSRQSPEDRELTQKLIGAWEIPETAQSIIWGVQTFNPDGTATYAGWVETEGKKQAISISLTWRIEGKKLHESVTRSTVPEFIRAGRSWSDDIVELTDRRLVTRDSRGGSETRMRLGQ